MVDKPAMSLEDGRVDKHTLAVEQATLLEASQAKSLVALASVGERIPAALRAKSSEASRAKLSADLAAADEPVLEARWKVV